MDMSSLSTFATPVVVGVGVVIIGVLLLMRERRSNSSPAGGDVPTASTAPSPVTTQAKDASSARA
ncbi:MAG: hypothetical protein ACO3XP_03150, partial [Ilumatobacteraceae bacterium]